MGEGRDLGRERQGLPHTGWFILRCGPAVSWTGRVLGPWLVFPLPFARADFTFTPAWRSGPGRKLCPQGNKHVLRKVRWFSWGLPPAKPP